MITMTPPGVRTFLSILNGLSQFYWSCTTCVSVTVSKCLLSGPATVSCEHSFFVFTSRPSLEIKVTTVRELHRLKRKKERKNNVRFFFRLVFAYRLTQFDYIHFVSFRFVMLLCHTTYQPISPLGKIFNTIDILPPPIAFAFYCIDDRSGIRYVYSL